MNYAVYINNKNGRQYLVLSPNGIDANNNASGDDFSIIYTDGNTIFHRKRDEFFKKFTQVGTAFLSSIQIPQRPFIPEKNHLQV